MIVLIQDVTIEQEARMTIHPDAAFQMVSARRTAAAIAFAKIR